MPLAVSLVLAAAGQRAPNRWEQRIPLTIAILGVVVGIAVLMRRGWSGRTERTSVLPAPARLPAQAGPLLLSPLPGLFLGTTATGDWLDRVSAHGLARRGRARAELRAEGVWLHRDGEPTLFLPGSAIVGARVDSAHAGKMLGAGGVLVLGWTLGPPAGPQVELGLRADQPELHELWARSVNHLARPVAEEVR